MQAYATFLVLVALLVALVSATPPACLLGVLGVQPDPSDLKALCGTLEGAIAGNITEKCGDNVSAAQRAFAATCLSSESVTISFTSSHSSTKTGSSSATTTGAGAKTTSTGASETTGGSGSGSSSTTPTATGSGASATTSGNAGVVISARSGMLMLAAGFAGQFLL